MIFLANIKANRPAIRRFGIDHVQLDAFRPRGFTDERILHLRPGRREQQPAQHRLNQLPLLLRLHHRGHRRGLAARSATHHPHHSSTATHADRRNEIVPQLVPIERGDDRPKTGDLTLFDLVRSHHLDLQLTLVLPITKGLPNRSGCLEPDKRFELPLIGDRGPRLLQDLLRLRIGSLRQSNTTHQPQGGQYQQSSLLHALLVSNLYLLKVHVYVLQRRYLLRILYRFHHFKYSSAVRTLRRGPICPAQRQLAGRIQWSTPFTSIMYPGHPNYPNYPNHPNISNHRTFNARNLPNSTPSW